MIYALLLSLFLVGSHALKADCPVGFEDKVDGLNSDGTADSTTDCTACDPGFYSDDTDTSACKANGTTPTACADLNKEFVQGGQEADNATCGHCVAGSGGDGAGGDTCTKCIAGKFSAAGGDPTTYVCDGKASCGTNATDSRAATVGDTDDSDCQCNGEYAPAAGENPKDHGCSECKAGNTGATCNIPCTTGHFKVQGAPSDDACAAHFADCAGLQRNDGDLGNLTKDATCGECKTHYSASGGDLSAADDNTKTCAEHCAIGSCSSDGGTSCAAPGTGKYSDAIAAIATECKSQTDCTNKVITADNDSDSAPQVCAECEAGFTGDDCLTVCTGNTFKVQGAPVDEACDAHTTTATTCSDANKVFVAGSNTANNASCGNCVAGFVSSNGTDCDVPCDAALGEYAASAAPDASVGCLNVDSETQRTECNNLNRGVTGCSTETGLGCTCAASCKEGHGAADASDVATSCDQCLPGYGGDGGTTCTKCTAGNFSAGGAANAVTCEPQTGCGTDAIDAHGGPGAIAESSCSCDGINFYGTGAQADHGGAGCLARAKCDVANSSDANAANKETMDALCKCDAGHGGVACAQCGAGTFSAGENVGTVCENLAGCHADGGVDANKDTLGGIANSSCSCNGTTHFGAASVAALGGAGCTEFTDCATLKREDGADGNATTDKGCGACLANYSAVGGDLSTTDNNTKTCAGHCAEGFCSHNASTCAAPGTGKYSNGIAALGDGCKSQTDCTNKVITADEDSDSAPQVCAECQAGNTGTACLTACDAAKGEYKVKGAPSDTACDIAAAFTACGVLNRGAESCSNETGAGCLCTAACKSGFHGTTDIATTCTQLTACDGANQAIMTAAAASDTGDNVCGCKVGFGFATDACAECTGETYSNEISALDAVCETQKTCATADAGGAAATEEGNSTTERICACKATHFTEDNGVTCQKRTYPDKCVPGVNWEKTAPSPSADRDCEEAVEKCATAGEAVLKGPTSLADATCGCDAGFGSTGDGACTACTATTDFSAVVTAKNTPCTAVKSSCGTGADDDNTVAGTTTADKVCACTADTHFLNELTGLCQAVGTDCTAEQTTVAATATSDRICKCDAGKGGATCVACEETEFQDGSGIVCATRTPCADDAQNKSEGDTDGDKTTDNICGCNDGYTNVANVCVEDIVCDDADGLVRDAATNTCFCKAGLIGDACDIPCPAGAYTLAHEKLDTSQCTTFTDCGTNGVKDAGSKTADNVCAASSAAALVFSMMTLFAMLL